MQKIVASKRGNFSQFYEPELLLVRRGDGPDPRLIELARLLARRAVREGTIMRPRDAAQSGLELSGNRFMRVALYARYSTDNQRDASIADQFRVCRVFAEKQGWHVVQEYSDHAVSGASLLRTGVQTLIADALAGRFQLVLAETMDRLSRDQEDIAGLYKRMAYADVKIVTLSEGEVTHLHVGLKGTMIWRTKPVAVNAAALNSENPAAERPTDMTWSGSLHQTVSQCAAIAASMRKRRRSFAGSSATMWRESRRSESRRS
jgi:hypothetical protein